MRDETIKEALRAWRKDNDPGYQSEGPYMIYLTRVYVAGVASKLSAYNPQLGTVSEEEADRNMVGMGWLDPKP